MGYILLFFSFFFTAALSAARYHQWQVKCWKISLTVLLNIRLPMPFSYSLLQRDCLSLPPLVVPKCLLFQLLRVAGCISTQGLRRHYYCYCMCKTQLDVESGLMARQSSTPRWAGWVEFCGFCKSFKSLHFHLPGSQKVVQVHEPIFPVSWYGGFFPVWFILLVRTFFQWKGKLVLFYVQH